MPGVIHDHCSAFLPMGIGSPFWKQLDLPRYELAWKGPEIDCAHPLDDGQIERFAPGFRDRVVATVSKGTADLAAYNPNFIGGDIIGGANAGLQVILRPRIALDPYATGVPGI